MLPIYFGDPQKPLFGIFYPAQSSRVRNRSAVLCNPIGNEYVGAYRTMRVLAEQLAEAGVSVLRFDYYSTGDSAGFGDEGSVQQWLADIAAAIDEVQGAADADRTSLIGVRLGATLAAFAANSREDIDRVVLWEPIINGQEHVTQHLARHRTWLRLGRCRAEDSTPNEALGFPFTETLKGQIEDIDLAALPEGGLERMLLLFHSTKKERRGRFLNRIARQVEQKVVDSPDFWLGRTAFDQPLVSKVNVETIVNWLTERPE